MNAVRFSNQKISKFDPPTTEIGPIINASAHEYDTI